MASDVQEPKVKMTRKARAAARRAMRKRKSPYDIADGTPTTMPSSPQRMHPGMDPANVNMYGAKILPR